MQRDSVVHITRTGGAAARAAATTSPRHTSAPPLEPLCRTWRAYSSIFRRRARFDRTVAAAAVASMYAPPVCVFRQCLQLQMPTAFRFTLSFPQKTHVYCHDEGEDGKRGSRGGGGEHCNPKNAVARARRCPSAHLGVLRHLDLAHDLTQGRAVACSVLSGDADLLCALSHLETVLRAARERGDGGEGIRAWARGGTGTAPRAAQMTRGTTVHGVWCM